MRARQTLLLWDVCKHNEDEGRRLMLEAIDEDFDEVLGEIVSDLLAEPLHGSNP